MSKHTINRRDLLKASAVAGAVVLTPTELLRAAEAHRSKPSGKLLGNKVLVHIFQHGGADGLSLVAPTTDPTYRNILRPTIRVGSPNEGTNLDGLFLDSTFAMHPSMPALHGLFTPGAGNLAIIHAAGYSPSNRSHFVSEDIVEKATNGSLLTSEGWANRFAQVTSQGPADAPVRLLGIGMNFLPGSMTGTYPGYSVSGMDALSFAGSHPDIESLMRSVISSTATNSYTATMSGLRDGADDAFDLMDTFSGIDPASYAPASTYPSTSLGQNLAQVAETIKADLGVEVFFAETHQWDHHAGVLAAMPAKAGDMSDSIAAFVADLGPTLMNDVVLVVQTEFGREALENASGGVDHGHGSVMFVLGGSSVGGQFHGTWPGVSIGSLTNGRFLASVNDHRDVFSDVLSAHFGLSVADLSAVFPGHVRTPLGVM